MGVEYKEGWVKSPPQVYLPSPFEAKRKCRSDNATCESQNLYNVWCVIYNKHVWYLTNHTYCVYDNERRTI